jgi:hypothetical protein
MGADQSQTPLVHGLTLEATRKPEGAPAAALPLLAACLAIWFKM